LSLASYFAKAQNNFGSGSPDLSHAPAAAVPLSIAAGNTISIATTIQNEGSAAADYSYLKYFLGVSTSRSAQDIYLGSDYVSPLKAGFSSNEQQTLTIAGTVAAGTYYLLLEADADHQVNE
jgi:hypothetical protein